MCPKRLWLGNTDECSQMFDQTINCIRDIFMHKYVLLHMTIRTTVYKVTKSKSKLDKIKNGPLLNYQT